MWMLQVFYICFIFNLCYDYLYKLKWFLPFLPNQNIWSLTIVMSVEKNTYKLFFFLLMYRCYLSLNLFSGIFSLHLTKLLASPRLKFKHNCLFTWLLSIFTLNIFFYVNIISRLIWNTLEIKAFLFTSGRQACLVPRTGFPQEKDKYRKMTAMKLLLITTHNF